MKAFLIALLFVVSFPSFAENSMPVKRYYVAGSKKFNTEAEYCSYVSPLTDCQLADASPGAFWSDFYFAPSSFVPSYCKGPNANDGRLKLSVKSCGDGNVRHEFKRRFENCFDGPCKWDWSVKDSITPITKEEYCPPKFSERY